MNEQKKTMNNPNSHSDWVDLEIPPKITLDLELVKLAEPPAFFSFFIRMRFVLMISNPNNFDAKFVIFIEICHCLLIVGNHFFLLCAKKCPDKGTLPRKVFPVIWKKKKPWIIQIVILTE